MDLFLKVCPRFECERIFYFFDTIPDRFQTNKKPPLQTLGVLSLLSSLLSTSRKEMLPFDSQPPENLFLFFIYCKWQWCGALSRQASLGAPLPLRLLTGSLCCEVSEPSPIIGIKALRRGQQLHLSGPVRFPATFKCHLSLRQHWMRCNVWWPPLSVLSALCVCVCVQVWAVR